MSKTATIADGVVNMLKALPKTQRDAVIVRIAQDVELVEDILDLATIASRRSEPSRPYREYRKERKAR
jgi:hypothetical protein